MSALFIGVFIEAFKSILADKRFQLPSPQATKACSFASSIVTWSKNPTSQASLTEMSSYVISSLESCMVTTIKTKKLKTGKTWGLYHLLRTSHEYKQQWIAFVMAANGTDSTTANHPSLYQSITHHLMKNLIKTSPHSSRK